MAINGVLFETFYNRTITNNCRLDEIRVGTTLASVTPTSVAVPEEGADKQVLWLGLTGDSTTFAPVSTKGTNWYQNKTASGGSIFMSGHKYYRGIVGSPPLSAGAFNYLVYDVGNVLESFGATGTAQRLLGMGGHDVIRGYYLAVKGKDYVSSTVWKKSHAVYVFYEYLCENGFLLLNPCPKVIYESENRLPHSVPDWQSLQQTYKRLKGSIHFWEHRDFAIIDLAYSCGLRRCELQGLNVDDIEQQEGTVRVKGKGGRERVVPVGPRALKDLLYYMYHIRPKFLKGGTTKALFVSWLGGGQRMNTRSINAIFRRLRIKYGFGKNFRPHNMRHAFATDLLRRGAPVQDVSRMLGHKKLETTQVYTRLVPRDLKRCHEKCHPRA